MIRPPATASPRPSGTVSMSRPEPPRPPGSRRPCRRRAGVEHLLARRTGRTPRSRPSSSASGLNVSVSWDIWNRPIRIALTPLRPPVPGPPAAARSRPRPPSASPRRSPRRTRVAHTRRSASPRARRGGRAPGSRAQRIAPAAGARDLVAEHVAAMDREPGLGRQRARRRPSGSSMFDDGRPVAAAGQPVGHEPAPVGAHGTGTSAPGAPRTGSRGPARGRRGTRRRRRCRARSRTGG